MHLHIETVENGFVVDEGPGHPHAVGKRHVFETAEALASHIADWGNGQETRREAQLSK